MTRVAPSTDGLEEAVAKDPHQVINFWRVLANNRAAHGGMTALIEAVWDHTGLSEREREIVILSVASELRSDYEWYQHTNLADREGLLARAELDAIERDDRTSFTTTEAVLIAYGRAVARGRVVSSLHDSLAAHHSPDTVVGIATLAAAYVAAALVMSALDIDLDDEPMS